MEKVKCIDCVLFNATDRSCGHLDGSQTFYDKVESENKEISCARYKPINQQNIKTN